MKNIMPKITADGTGYEAIRAVFSNINKVELQLLQNEYTYNNMPQAYDIYIRQINGFLEEHPEINELTVHSPLYNYEIESLFLRDSSFIIWTTKYFIKLSEKHNKKINILYHTNSNYNTFICDWEKYFSPVLELLEDSKITILFENTMFNQEKGKCSPIEIAKHYNNEHIKVCLDLCHVQCKANIFKRDIKEYFKEYISREDTQYIKQVHFSATLNNDGYIDKTTHGRVHPDFNSVEKDFKLLTEFNIKPEYWVTEITEEDYVSRKEQIKEIKYLKELINNKK